MDVCWVKWEYELGKGTEEPSGVIEIFHILICFERMVLRQLEHMQKFTENGTKT